MVGSSSPGACLTEGFPTMTTVDFGHRDHTASVKLEDYQQLHDRIIEKTSRVKGVCSLVSCGSLIKGTLVPGWSDLDIIIFYCSPPNQWLLLNQVSGVLSDLSTLYTIGVGIDFVSFEGFRRTLRIGGRPLAMSREVAGYGKLCFGPNPFDELVWSNEYLQMARSEALSACRATIHNWRRHVIARRKTDEPARNPLYDAKVGLKILKYESDPNTGPSYTYDAALRNVQLLGQTDRFSPELFEACVRTRKAWAHVVQNRDQLMELGIQIPKLLSRYREPEE